MASAEPLLQRTSTLGENFRCKFCNKVLNKSFQSEFDGRYCKFCKTSDRLVQTHFV